VVRPTHFVSTNGDLSHQNLHSAVPVPCRDNLYIEYLSKRVMSWKILILKNADKLLENINIVKNDKSQSLTFFLSLTISSD